MPVLWEFQGFVSYFQQSLVFSNPTGLIKGLCLFDCANCRASPIPCGIVPKQVSRFTDNTSSIQICVEQWFLQLAPDTSGMGGQVNLLKICSAADGRCSIWCPEHCNLQGQLHREQLNAASPFSLVCGRHPLFHPEVAGRFSRCTKARFMVTQWLMMILFWSITVVNC